MHQVALAACVRLAVVSMLAGGMLATLLLGSMCSDSLHSDVQQQ
jgi:hypothetical protein